MLAGWLQRQWFEQRRLSPALWLWVPLAGVFALLATLRRILTRPGHLPVPVVVVGNITVGGAGKTPLTIALARALREKGWQPAIVSRGYGGQNTAPQAVLPDSSAFQVGDEPLLLARQAGVPVWVGRDRLAAAQALLAAHPTINLILCDDGLQHYRLGRDVELAVFDGRGAGNGWRLPLGPLREPVRRLLSVDAIICNGQPDSRLPQSVPSFGMSLRPAACYRLDQPAVRRQAQDFAGQRLYALAGMGDPGRFFRTLSELGLDFSAHPFSDHHAYTADDLLFAADGVLLMTEKDAVKCVGLTQGETWVLPVEAEFSPALVELVLEKLRGRQAA